MNRETLKDVLTAVAIGLALCALVLHGLDALFY
jgi:multisubunit Na+/H+ antiporter MnhC subunit